ncbi:hypothetical protein DFH11DRAFT_1592146 [Phellopilus nigrolimitatus]|nr:hypothetical protein DFH11DRAFT_1592146 [Phellopilus nigrolimitatus]
MSIWTSPSFVCLVMSCFLSYILSKYALLVSGICRSHVGLNRSPVPLRNCRNETGRSAQLWTAKLGRKDVLAASVGRLIARSAGVKILTLPCFGGCFGTNYRQIGRRNRKKDTRRGQHARHL